MDIDLDIAHNSNDALYDNKSYKDLFLELCELDLLKFFKNRNFQQQKLIAIFQKPKFLFRFLKNLKKIDRDLFGVVFFWF